MKNYHITYSYKHQNNVVIVDCDIEEVHKSDIKRGDTILLDNGDTKTICMNNLTWDKFLGRCICGDSYNIGRKLVKRVHNLRIGTPKQFGF